MTAFADLFVPKPKVSTRSSWFVQDRTVDGDQRAPAWRCPDNIHRSSCWGESMHRDLPSVTDVIAGGGPVGAGITMAEGCTGESLRRLTNDIAQAPKAVGIALAVRLWGFVSYRFGGAEPISSADTRRHLRRLAMANPGPAFLLGSVVAISLHAQADGGAEDLVEICQHADTPEHAWAIAACSNRNDIREAVELFAPDGRQLVAAAQALRVPACTLGSRYTIEGQHRRVRRLSKLFSRLDEDSLAYALKLSVNWNDSPERLVTLIGALD